MTENILTSFYTVISDPNVIMAHISLSPTWLETAHIHPKDLYPSPISSVSRNSSPNSPDVPTPNTHTHTVVSVGWVGAPPQLQSIENFSSALCDPDIVKIKSFSGFSTMSLASPLPPSRVEWREGEGLPPSLGKQY